MSEPTATAIAFGQWRTRIENALAVALSDGGLPPTRLHAAMRHAVLDGGKRMRPLLVYVTGTTFGAEPANLDGAAVAVELIHAYSLVHDDLPAMDDDRLRRGKPTVHVAFDDATAILAGDALQSLAFETLASASAPSDTRIAMLRELAVAAGAHGMCAGQALDIEATGADSIEIEQLQRLHALKTGALLRASVRLGAMAAGAGPEARRHLDDFADALGLAFQIRDDLLDVEGDSATLGKTVGKDQARAKATFPASIGVEASRDRLRTLADTMTASLTALHVDTAALAALGHLAIERSR